MPEIFKYLQYLIRFYTSVDDLDKSINDAEKEENMISFTMEEFMTYTPEKS